MAALGNPLNGRHDDPADALIQGLTCLNKGKTCYMSEIKSGLLRDEIKRGLLIKGSPLCLTNPVTKIRPYNFKNHTWRCDNFENLSS